LEKDAQFIAPVHNSIIIDEKGNKWIAYQLIWKDKSKAGPPSGNGSYLKRVMCISPLQDLNGWPLVIQ
jgi:hypothetical protein